MKKILSFIVPAFLFLCTIFNASAQSVFNVYVYPVALEKTQYSVGETVKGEFTLHNLDPVRLSDIHYRVAYGSAEDGKEFFVPLYVSEQSDALYLESSSKRNIPFEFEVPNLLNGNAYIQIQVERKDGTALSQYEAPIVVSGATPKEVIVPVAAIVVNDEGFPLQTGPTVTNDDEVSVKVLFGPAEKTHTIKPVITLYNRVNDTEPLLVLSEYPEFTTSVSEDTEITLDLPADLDPLVYAGAITLESDDATIAPLHFRYIVSGPIATVLNVNADTLTAKKGDTVNVTLVYGGTPEAFNNPEVQSAPPTASAEIVAYNQDGVEVGRATKKLDLLNSREQNFEISLSESAESLRFTAEIKDEQGKVISSYQTELPSEKELKKAYATAYDFLNARNLIIALGLVALIALLAFLRKKNVSTLNITAVAIAFLLVQGAVTFSVQEASAQLAIEKVNSGKNLNLNSVVTPLPASVKGYDPGENFYLSYNLTFGDCNNQGFNLEAYYPKLNNFDVPPLSTSATNKAWWTANGRSLVRLNSEVMGNMSNLDQFLNGEVAYSWDVLGSAWGDMRKGGGPQARELTIQLRDRYLELRSQEPNKSVAEVSYIYDCKHQKYYGFCLVKGTKYASPAFSAKMEGDSQVRSIVQQLNALPKAWREYVAIFSNTGQSSGWLMLGSGSLGNDSSNFHSDFSKTARFSGANKAPLAAPMTPGLHKIYFYIYAQGQDGVRDITASQTICVKGIGLCPDEEVVDLCPNILGEQKTLPEGHVKNETGDCVPQEEQICPGLPLPPEGYGEACGCPDNPGTIQCDGACRTASGSLVDGICSTDLPMVTCVPDSSSVDVSSGPKSVRFSISNIRNMTGPYTFEWSRGDSVNSDATVVTFGTDNQTSRREQVSVTVAGEGVSQTGVCSVVVSGSASEMCPNPAPGYGQSCCNGAGTIQCNGNCSAMCGNEDGTDPDASFSFSPNIVSANQQCMIVLNANNVQSCVLKRNGVNSIQPILANEQGRILSDKQYGVSVGTHTLYCTDENDVETSFGSRMCVSNPNIGEF